MEQIFLEIGKIVNTHGLRGDVKVVPWSDYPEIFEEIDFVYLDKNTKLQIKNVKYQKNNVILKLDTINSIEQAEKLKEKVLLVDKDDIEILDEDTYFVADLIGLSVYEDDEKLGVLSDVIPVAGADVYVIKREKGKDILIPAIKENIKEINISEKYIKVKIPDGLFD
ncbi:MAG: 16S rRNA processing protein RimM [Ruminococcaceae bacterium]|nr:16S rRNA processing protein RimM [Oscillospiraceae bacterium]